MIRIIKVKGTSMAPVYMPGDYVFIVTWFKHLFCSKEKDVVLNHPKYGCMIKRVQSIDLIGQTYRLKGLSSTSVSTAQIGMVPQDMIVGRVIAHFPAPQ